MMKYKGTFITLFPIFMKKIMIEQYGVAVTKKSLKRAPAIYRDMLSKVDGRLLIKCLFPKAMMIQF